jgi:hypothetical protein
MIDLLGFMYGLAKDLKEYFEWDEEDKLVDMNWLEDSGFGNNWRQKGYELKWSRPDRLASRMLDGWDIIFEIDKYKRIRRRLILRDGMVLIGRLKT